MKFYKCVYIIVSLLISSNCLPDELTPEELCRKRNAAHCDINGVKFFIEDNCPRGAQTLRAKGKERCESLAEVAKTQEKIHIPPVVSQPDSEPASPPIITLQENNRGYFDNPFIVVFVAGVLLGLIGRVGWKQLVTAGLVMPLLVAWAVTSSPVQAVGLEYFSYFGMELFKLAVVSLFGWGVGLFMYRVAIKPKNCS